MSRRPRYGRATTYERTDEFAAGIDGLVQADGWLVMAPDYGAGAGLPGPRAIALADGTPAAPAARLARRRLGSRQTRRPVAREGGPDAGARRSGDRGLARHGRRRRRQEPGPGAWARAPGAAGAGGHARPGRPGPRTRPRGAGRRRQPLSARLPVRGRALHRGLVGRLAGAQPARPDPGHAPAGPARPHADQGVRRLPRRRAGPGRLARGARTGTAPRSAAHAGAVDPRAGRSDPGRRAGALHRALGRRRAA